MQCTAQGSVGSMRAWRCAAVRWACLALKGHMSYLRRPHVASYKATCPGLQGEHGRTKKREGVGRSRGQAGSRDQAGTAANALSHARKHARTHARTHAPTRTHPHIHTHTLTCAHAKQAVEARGVVRAAATEAEEALEDVYRKKKTQRQDPNMANEGVCHALKKGDGERCTRVVHGTRFCGKHESSEMRGGEVAEPTAPKSYKYGCKRCRFSANGCSGPHGCRTEDS